MEDLRVRRGLVIPASELSEGVSRSSGPGGQHVNKSQNQSAKFASRLPVIMKGETGTSYTAASCGWLEG